MASSSANHYQRLPAFDIDEPHDNKKVIKLPISSDLIHHWSSGDYTDLYSAALSPADIGFTYAARYPSVIASILSGSGQVGPVIEATSQSWPLALCFYVLIAGAASYNFYLKYNEKKHAHQKVASTHKDIAEKLGKEYIFSSTEEPQPPTEVEDKNFLVDFNTALAEVVEEGGASKKYESLSIEDHNGQYALSCKFKTKDDKDHDRDSKSEPELADAVAKPTRWERFKNAVSTAYSAVGLGAFTYWILWIGSAIATGNFADAGIAGLSPWISFGLPMLAASTYPALKIRNWIRKGGHQSDEQARLTKIAETDTPELMAKALKRVEFNRVESQLKNEYLNLAGRHLKQAKFAGKREELVDRSAWSDPKLQAAAALYTGVAGHYGTSQYNAWVTSDFFKVVFNAATSIPFIVPVFGQIVGSVLIAIGAGLGLKEMWNHYKEAKAQRKNAPKTESNFRQSSLEEIFEERKRDLNHLNHRIAAAILNDDLKNKRTLTDQEASEIMAKAVGEKRIPHQLTTPLPNDPPKMSLGRQIYNGLDWFATGAFFGRLVSVPLTAIFIPFAIPLLSNPITISMIALAGAIFLGCKFYQAYQKSKKMQAERLIQKIQELDEKIHLSKLTNVNLQLRNKIENQKQQGSGFTNSPTSVPKSIVHARQLSADNGDEKSTHTSQLGMFASLDGDQPLVPGSPQTPRQSHLDVDGEEDQLRVPLLPASHAAETDILDDPSGQDAEFESDNSIQLADLRKSKQYATIRM